MSKKTKALIVTLCVLLVLVAATAAVHYFKLDTKLLKKLEKPMTKCCDAQQSDEKL